MNIPYEEIVGKIAGIAVLVVFIWTGAQEAKKKSEQKPSSK
jgi:hypothetical protein